MKNKIILTGIKPTGTAHLGNYLGAIEPAIKRANEYQDSFFFLADYHALNSITDPSELKALTHKIAATWLASGLDIKKSHFYKQSDIKETFELETILNATVPKGWMNKAHAYKASVDANRANKKDDDEDINMGLYTYPILMASDILIFNANIVPVGKDQIQHVEIARDIAGRFNAKYKTSVLTLPEHVIETGIGEIPGIDGRKMSKSYNNIIPLFASVEQWHKAVKKIVTDSNDNHTLETIKATVFYRIFSSIASSEQSDKIASDLVGKKIGWKESKDQLLDIIIKRFGTMTETYDNLMKDTDAIDKLLDDGAKAIQPLSVETIMNVRKAIGII